MSYIEAMDLAHRMRAIMSQDIDEFDVSRQVEAENERLNAETPDLLQEAWKVLTSSERSAWKEWITWRKVHGGQ